MGCLLVTMAFGIGGTAQFQQSISANDATEIRVTPPGGGSQGPALDDAAVELFKNMDGVVGATGVITLPMRIKAGRYEAQNIEVTAVDPQALQGRLAFQAGGLFPAQSNLPQIVLGYGAQFSFKNNLAAQTQTSAPGAGQPSATPSAPPVDWPSQAVQLSPGVQSQGGDASGLSGTGAANRIYSGTVAGVLKEDRSDRNGQALMDLSLAKKILREDYGLASALHLNANSYAFALVFAKDLNSVKAVMEKINGMGFAAASAVADLEGLQEKLGLQQTLLIAIQIFIIILSCLTAAYLQLAGGIERRAGIAQGPSGAAAARGVVLAESASLGFAGGVAGILLGYFFALITNTSSTETVLFGMRFGQSENLVIPFRMAMETAGISTVIGLIGGWLSAKAMGKASQTDPSGPR